jgi:hypothetical protein
MNVGGFGPIELRVKLHGERVDFFSGQNFILNFLVHVLKPGKQILWGVISSPRLYGETFGILDSHLQRMN